MNKMETTLATWFKKMPHLPKKVNEWLARNLWWIILIFAVLLIVAVAFGVIATVFSSIATSVQVGLFAGINTGVVGTVSVIFNAVIAIIYLAAIAPLNLRLKRGWDFLFFATILAFVFGIVLVLISQNSTLFGELIGLLVSLYLLFEIRPLFTTPKRTPRRKEVIDV